MTTTLIIVGIFVLAVVVFAKLAPGKKDTDLVFESDEALLYECENLHILRHPQLGRPVAWPGSKIQITNKRIVFSQKGLMSSTYVIREVAVRKNNPPEGLRGKTSWGLVSVFAYHKNDFSVVSRDNKDIILFANTFAPNLDHMEIVGSVVSRDNKDIILFANTFAPNLDHMEIVGVASVSEFMQAIE